MGGRLISLIPARGQQAEIVADLRKLDRKTFQAGRIKNEGLGVLGRLDQVRCEPDRLAGDLDEVLDAAVRIAFGRVQTGADGGAAHVDLEQNNLDLRQGGDLVLEALRPGVELLA